MFDSIVFAITDQGFVARSAREGADAGEFRLAKIHCIIQECNYGVHDISAVKLDGKHKLPRFNMPLELGLSFSVANGTAARSTRVKSH